MAVQMPAQMVDVLIAAQTPALKADLTTAKRVRVAVNVRQKVVPRSVVKSALPMSYAQKARAVKSANRVSHVLRVRAVSARAANGATAQNVVTASRAMP